MVKNWYGVGVLDLIRHTANRISDRAVLAAYLLFILAGFSVHRAVGLVVAGLVILVWDLLRDRPGN